MSSSSWISSGNPFTPDTMSSTNPFTSDTSEEELEAPRPGPVSKLFGLPRLSNNLLFFLLPKICFCVQARARGEGGERAEGVGGEADAAGDNIAG